MELIQADAKPNEKVLLTAEEVARLTGFGKGRVYEMIADGSLPVVRVGSRVRIHWPTFSAWMESEAKAGFNSDRLRARLRAA